MNYGSGGPNGAQSERNFNLLNADPSAPDIRKNVEKMFFFDRLFGEAATEDEVFSNVNEEIRAAMEGILFVCTA